MDRRRKVELFEEIRREYRHVNRHPNSGHAIIRRLDLRSPLLERSSRSFRLLFSTSDQDAAPEECAAADEGSTSDLRDFDRSERMLALSASWTLTGVMKGENCPGAAFLLVPRKSPELPQLAPIPASSALPGRLAPPWARRAGSATFVHSQGANKSPFFSILCGVPPTRRFHYSGALVGPARAACQS